jgi:hypothetical protein
MYFYFQDVIEVYVGCKELEPESLKTPLLQGFTHVAPCRDRN